MFIVWFPLSGGIKSRTWQGRILGPQFANRSKFANGQSSCIGRNICMCDSFVDPVQTALVLAARL